MYKIITNNDINGLGTLNAKFLSLSYIQLTDYSTIVNKFDVKPTIYRIGLASFTMANHMLNEQSFIDELLPLHEKSKNTSSSKIT